MIDTTENFRNFTQSIKINRSIYWFTIIRQLLQYIALMYTRNIVLLHCCKLKSFTIVGTYHVHSSRTINNDTLKYMRLFFYDRCVQTRTTLLHRIIFYNTILYNKTIKFKRFRTNVFHPPRFHKSNSKQFRRS